MATSAAGDSHMDKAVSPPPSKRRRLDKPQQTNGKDLENTLSVYAWNVNGIQPFIQTSITSFFERSDSVRRDSSTTKASLRDFLMRHGWPALLFLQEVKISPDDQATIRAVKRAVKKQQSELVTNPDYDVHMCLPSDPYNARGFGRKVYGVCSIIRKDFSERFVERVRPVDWDKEGRILILETRASKFSPKLAIINIYAVNGTEHPYKDSHTGEEAGTRHDRKLQVHKLLQTECCRLEAQGFGVIVAGDLNIARSRIDGHPKLRTFPQQHCINRADFEARFFGPLSGTEKKARTISGSMDGDTSDDGLRMIDTFRHLHPTKKGYTFYPRSCNFGESCDRVDMILASRALKDYIVEADMLETPSERGPSDHVPLFAKFKFEATLRD